MVSIEPVKLMDCLDKDLSNLSDYISLIKGTHLKNSVFKKFVPLDRATSLDVEAKENFLSWNATIRNCGDLRDWEEDSLMRQWKDEIHLCFSEDSGPCNLDLVRALNYGYCGPGASRLTEKNDFLTKMFDSPLSHTRPFLYLLYKEHVSERWLAADENRHAKHSSLIVEGSTLSTVPKDKDRNRTICTEPTLNMFYQLGAKQIIENILEKRFHIKMESQPDVNKSLARLASIDGSFATIDLKNASDSVSIDLVKFLLPRHVYNQLDAIRSPRTFVKGEYHELNMFSTMGNGFTFPLMTLIFCAMLRVAYRHHNLLFRNHYFVQQGRIFLQKETTFAVWGDDIICRSETVDTVLQLLSASGFTVNLDKSYTTGPFRESCGGDYHLGHNVRGVYIKELQNEQDVYSVFNRLNLWSCNNRIPLVSTLRYVLSACKFRPVPLHAGDKEGLLLPRKHLLSPKSDRNGALYYHAYRPRRFGTKVGDSYGNPIAAEIAAIGGYIRGHFIAARPSSVKYDVVKLRTPSWDSWRHSDVLRRELEDSWLRVLDT